MTIFQNHHDSILLKFFAPFIVLCLLGAQPCPAEPTGESEVVITMASSVIKKDVPSARSAAVDQCLLMAVEKTALGILPVDRITEKFDTLGTLLAGRRDEFIQDYKVLKETHDGKTYRVLVQTTVFSAKLKQELNADGRTDQPDNLPKILFMVTEQQAGDPSIHYWWQSGNPILQPDSAVAAMKQAFSGRGFSVVDEKTVPFSTIEDLEMGPEISDPEAIETGKRANADLVVAGNAIAAEAPNRMGETALTFKGTVTARAILVATGETLPESVNSQTALNPDKAAGSRQTLAEAGKQAGLDLCQQILAKWKEQSATGGDLFISLTGPDILPHLAAFRTALKDIDGVSSHQTLEMGSDKATIRVTFDGTPQALADALVLKTFASFGINIFEITGNQIQIQLTSR
ncbi:MAG: hypothetical protein C4518_03645 [Desulfobacteraceae bacterium]|nr:MAG: hypothetical protein C4518_03645 [Desulfobacteraceae bacterium]